MCRKWNMVCGKNERFFWRKTNTNWRKSNASQIIIWFHRPVLSYNKRQSRTRQVCSHMIFISFFVETNLAPQRLLNDCKSSGKAVVHYTGGKFEIPLPQKLARKPNQRKRPRTNRTEPRYLIDTFYKFIIYAIVLYFICTN